MGMYTRRLIILIFSDFSFYCGPQFWNSVQPGNFIAGAVSLVERGPFLATKIKRNKR